MSDLMAPLILLLILLTGAASDLMVVTVHPGDDVILPCQAADSSIRAVEWTRPDLKPTEYVLYYSDRHLDPTYQHPSFKDRVELVDRDLKDGDVSLTLKNVSRHDAGTYKCRVKSAVSNHIRLISTICLQVPDLVVVPVPGDDVILPCQADDSSIIAVEWTRPDLEPEYVLLYRDGHLDPTHQHPSFKDRVELVDRDLKDGDVSLTLKNVSRHDAGTYKCRVKSAVSNHIRLISTICLQVPDLVVVPVPGDDVILPCQADDSSIIAVEWTRPDLEPEYVLLYRDGHLETDHQHPSFKDRVELVDRDLKDGDVSLILKNVNSIDNGTYECRVKPAGSRRERRAIIDSKPIRIIRLQVPEPAGSNRGHSEDGNSSPVVLIVGLVAGVLVLVAAAVVGVLMYRRRKNKRSGQPADDDEASADTLV
ncbi:coxsackievirus and adenovirus receptor-like isoform X2 [Perca flavescens]|uniref:coxsackievirus and adenovirus receptor-like isoform X2 n=1 Tax=Perca flavescens TaxID=8167 RepID=UPI00106E691B|nr:coxsackievirus and adenovirus receptor-like isoform X2 [Perca flavescens]